MIITNFIIPLIVQRPILAEGCLTFLHCVPHPTKAFWPRAWWLKPNACNQWKLFHTLRTHHEANDDDGKDDDGDDEEPLCDEDDDDGADNCYYGPNHHNHDHLHYCCHHYSHLCRHDQP